MAEMSGKVFPVSNWDTAEMDTLNCSASCSCVMPAPLRYFAIFIPRLFKDSIIVSSLSVRGDLYRFKSSFQILLK